MKMAIYGQKMLPLKILLHLTLEIWGALLKVRMM
jgi:hypothetical protein